jgi:hypothetical protein
VTVVSNTGPIVALAKADHLSLLRILYGEVLIPPAVHRELLAKVGPEAGWIDEGLAGFLRVTPIPRPAAALIRLSRPNPSEVPAGQGSRIGRGPDGPFREPYRRRG